MRPKTILVIDDEKQFAMLVQRTLEQAGFEVIVAMDGTSGLAIAEQHRPDLVVLDLTMPDIDGLEVCSKLRADPRRRQLPILMLSARAAAPDRVIGLETGADDYLVKPFVPQELVARVKSLLRRVDALRDPTAVIRAGNLSIDLHAHQVTYLGAPVSLTAAQTHILEFLAVHAGRVFSRDEIIEANLRDDVDVTPRTVDAHIVGIRRALGPAAAVIETRRSFGYAFQPAALHNSD